MYFPELQKSRLKPSQEASEKKISLLEKTLNSLCAAKDTLPTPDIEKQILKTREQLKHEKQSLKRKMQIVKAQQNYRTNRKRKLEDIAAENPGIKEKLCMRNTVGRPNLEKDQPLLLKTIADIAMYGSAADARRRTETIRSVKTLDELTEELKKIGFHISRSGTYLRLLPRNSNTIEGRRHVMTVPVKLTRAQADYHQNHIDRHFATTSIQYLESLTSILGPDQVLFISQDDKARVPIGLTAANKQAPLLMHMEYRVKLPDHDWVIAERHKLIPSVYAGIKIQKVAAGNQQAIGYSGPTFIAIRSGKHCMSTANSHAQDFETLINLEEFHTLARTEHGNVKPVVVLTVDGGPDENPRYEKVIAFAIQHFKKYNLDGLFIVTNAPGRSAFNRVERRMAPLSHELAGLILPHDHFGSHLDDKGRTVDEDLEKSNFQFAGKVLANVWGSLTIDGFPVIAKYIEPGNIVEAPDFPELQWLADHVRESQYLLQIVRCKNEKCCSPARSGLFRVLNDRFLPPPIKMKATSSDLTVDEEGEFIGLLLRLSLDLQVDAKGFLQVPYDYFCPSVKQKLASRSCKYCGLYHASIKSMNRHYKVHDKLPKAVLKVRPIRVAARREREVMCVMQALGGEIAEWVDEEEVEQISQSHAVNQAETSNIIIDNFDLWIKGEWTEIHNS